MIGISFRLDEFSYVQAMESINKFMYIEDESYKLDHPEYLHCFWRYEETLLTKIATERDSHDTTFVGRVLRSFLIKLIFTFF